MRGNLIIQSGLRLSSSPPHPPQEIESSMTLDDPRREVVTLYMLYFSSPVKASHEDQHFESIKPRLRVFTLPKKPRGKSEVQFHNIVMFFLNYSALLVASRQFLTNPEQRFKNLWLPLVNIKDPATPRCMSHNK